MAETFTLDKDNLVSPVIALAESPMQVSITQDSSWTYNKTRVYVQEETATPGTYATIAGTAIKNKSLMEPFRLKAKNYKLILDDYADTDSITFIVS